MPRLLRRSIPLIAGLMVLSPLLREPRSDTYPLSTYPMFAVDRGAIHGVSTVVELTPEGSSTRLSPELIAGTDEVVLAAVTVARSVARGEADLLCQEVLERRGSGPVIEVRTETVDVVEVVMNGAAALSIEIHAVCGGGG